MELERYVIGRTAGVLYLPPDYAAPRKGWRGLWRRHLIANGGVRDRDYMQALFRSRFPNAALIDLDTERLAAQKLDDVDNVVLLYPDPIGMDFGPIERAIAERPGSGRVLVLNGRQRFFALDRATRRRLAVRRFLAASRLPEFTFLIAFVAVTPFLAVFDLLRGRR